MAETGANLNAAVKEAAERVSDASVPVREVTDVLEARLAEVVSKYDSMMNSVMAQYSEVLDQYIGKVEPIEMRVKRVIQSTFTGQEVFDILAALEQETGVTTNMQPSKLLDIIESVVPKKPAISLSAKLPVIAKPADKNSKE